MGSNKENADEVPPLKINAFPTDLEEDARELYNLVCRNAEHLLVVDGEPVAKERLADQNFRKKFYSTAHAGFHQAQEKVIAFLQEGNPDKTKEVLYRKIMDCAAWQMLNRQLYIARRLYREGKQPSVLHSNLESVRSAAIHLGSEAFYRFALISDLTTFIQIGDLLVIDPDEGLTIIEVKEGEVNKKILEFKEFIGESQCPRAIQYFLENEEDKTVRQLERTLRQDARMAHISQLLNSGRSTDPDTKQDIFIPDEPLPMDSWDEELASVIEKSKTSGWAISTTDECLFIGAYREKMRFAGPYAFDVWFDGCGGKPGYPKMNLMSTMAIPLALPIFIRSLPIESIFDILFGRVVVHVALQIDVLIEICKKQGLDARWSSTKEAGRMRNNPQAKPWIFENKMVMVGKGDNIGPISDGLFLRIFGHGITVASAAEILGALSNSTAPE